MPVAHAIEPDPRAATDAVLLRRYASGRHASDRERLVVRYLPLARYAANRYARRSEPFDDLLQVASVGLLKAIDRYDPAVGAAFPSFALPTMLGELRRHFRDRAWAVRPPRTLQEQALQVERTTAEFTVALGRVPTVADVADGSGLTLEEVLEAREAAIALAATPLSARVGIGRGDDVIELGDLLGAEDAGYARVDDCATTAVLLRTLTGREREILRLRMEEDLTQSQIGERVGLSQMHVSRLLRQILEKLRAAAAHRARETGATVASVG